MSNRTRAAAIAREHIAVFVLVAALKPELTHLAGRLSPVREAVGANDLRRPTVAFAFRTKPFRNRREEDAHRGETLLAVHDADGGHHSGRPRLRKRKKRAAVVTRIGSRGGHRHEILDQPLDLALAPAIAALPAGDDVLDLAV
ncbi:MAG: hypothetical protein OXH15_02470 [Gammaproteobacteria bacterium]|nr:hypothetical protein [Gammaproteobacteria bacterium]